jgi:hypothetical protein
MLATQERIIAINGNIYNYDELLSCIPDNEYDYTMEDLHGLFNAKSISEVDYDLKLAAIRHRLSNEDRN